MIIDVPIEVEDFSVLLLEVALLERLEAFRQSLHRLCSSLDSFLTGVSEGYPVAQPAEVGRSLLRTIGAHRFELPLVSHASLRLSVLCLSLDRLLRFLAEVVRIFPLGALLRRAGLFLLFWLLGRALI